ncbi:MAG: hypothetical protein C0393_04705 [Anaerolinea sp.]|nr:hypothetical protein [Anaerolinea sp.]
MRIIVVDDKEEERYLLETLLKGSGYEVETAPNGAEALEKLRTVGFDMIVSDVLMPVMDGFQLCRECKADEKLKDIPFIFYTATYKDEKDEELALKIGASKFIRKPLEPDEFIKCIKGAIADVEKGKVGPKKTVLEEEKEFFKLYSERLVKKLEKKMLDLEIEITERKQAEEQVQHQLQRLTALRNIDMAITASLDVRVTLNVLLDEVTNVLRIDAATVLLLNPNTLNLEYAASRGFRTSALQHTYLRMGEGHAGCAALEHRIVSIPNLAETLDSLSRSPLLANEGFISYYAVPLIAKGNVKGVLEILHRAILDPDQEWLDFLETLATQAALAIDNASLLNDLQRSNVELILAYDSTLEGWSKALDLRDKETEGHSQRVTDMTLKIARVMGISDTELVHVRRGALLHDMGKMGVPDAILHNPGPLTDEEWAVMRKHPQYAFDMLSPIAYLRPALDIPGCHHEKWDGTGYPRGLKGEQIPLAARIFAVVDVYDALTSDRPYRKAWPKEKTIKHIKAEAGAHFDPQVVEAFLGYSIQ